MDDIRASYRYYMAGARGAVIVPYWSPLGHGGGSIEENQQRPAEAESQKNTPTNRVWHSHASPFSTRTLKNIYRSDRYKNILFLDSHVCNLFGDNIP